MATSAANVIIFCFGNSARGDDALGELMHERLQQTRLQQPDLFQQVELVLDFQLEPEHIFDLKNADIGIFVDASADASVDIAWEPVATGSQLHFSSHHLPPESLLFLFEETFRSPAPPCYTLSMGAEAFELGAPPSTLAITRLEQAHQLLLTQLQTLLRL